MRLLAFLCFVSAMVGIGVNGLIMLISPRIWFKMPFWIRASGSLSKEKYGSGWCAVQIRLLGAIFLGLVIWFVYGAFSGS
jgi:hypothetical protein